MITDLRNMQAHPPGVRSVGPHIHTWVEIGRDAQGEIYRECSFCGARSCAYRARFEALRQDWLNYREEWSVEASVPAEAPREAPTVEEASAAGGEEDAPPRRKPGRPRKSP